MIEENRRTEMIGYLDAFTLLISAGILLFSIVSFDLFSIGLKWSILLMLIIIYNLSLGEWDRKAKSLLLYAESSLLTLSIIVIAKGESAVLQHILGLAFIVFLAIIGIFAWRSNLVTSIPTYIGIILYTVYLITGVNLEYYSNGLVILLAALSSLPLIAKYKRIHVLLPLALLIPITVYSSPNELLTTMILVPYLLFVVYSLRAGKTCPFRTERILVLAGLFVLATISILLIAYPGLFYSLMYYWILGYLTCVSGLTSPPYFKTLSDDM